MRPIKFRAWHKDLKIMREVIELNLRFDEVTVLNNEKNNVNCPYSTWFEGTFELMQFTGLLDTNGKEIYEGDIIINLLCNIRQSHIFGEVFFHHDTASFKVKDEYRIIFNHIGGKYSKDWEIIGNIYENPELFGNK